MKIVTWNVNSINAREARALAWIEKYSPDVLCFQELKLTEDRFPLMQMKALGYHCAVLGQKTYNGVAIISKEPIENIVYGIPGYDDPQARFVQGTIAGVTIISAYFPNGGNLGSDKYTYKQEWMDRLRDYLQSSLSPEEHEVILCGDYNVAPFDDDVARPEEWGDGVLTSDIVRNKLSAIENLGFVDPVRPFFPRGRMYTWWDYRAMGFEQGNGLRIDHTYLSRSMAPFVRGAWVDQEERSIKGASDHAPLMIDLDIDALRLSRQAAVV